MPPLPSPGNVIELKLRGTLGSDQDVLNRFFVQYLGTAPTAAEMNAYAAAVAGDWQTAMAPVVSADYTLAEVDATDLSSSSGAFGSALPAYKGTNVAGSIAGSAMVIKQVINRRYRGGKPRKYIAGVPTTMAANDNTWNSGYVSNMQTSIDDFVAAIITSLPSGVGGGNVVNVSWYSGFTAVQNPVTHRYRNIPTLRAVPIVDVVVAHVAQSSIGSQRRRNEYVSVL